MYKKIPFQKTSIKVNDSYVGERIEEKIQRIMSNKEPIKDGAPLIYTDRNDGVQPDYNIRTDRFEAAIEAMDIVSKSKRAKRAGKAETIGDKAAEGMKKEGGETPKSKA